MSLRRLSRQARAQVGLCLRAVRAGMVGAVLLSAAAAHAASPVSPGAAFDARQALAVSQQAIGRQIGDHAVRTSAGETMQLAELRGKPVVLSLVFTSCYHICPVTTRHLAKVVDKAREAVGRDGFRVVTLGFDSAHDSPEAMRDFARQQGIDGKDWLLLSAGPETVAALTRELGFVYFPSPRGFDHLIQATVIDAEGRIYRQVYGETFDTQLLVEPLLDLVLGRSHPGQSLLDDFADRVRLFCTTYDPSRDAYVIDISLFIGLIIGALIIGWTLIFIVREYRRGRRASRA